ncbi:MAG TPA: sigma-70 family RNA polymerase sigma factor [Mycobacteriales bacterium]|jgi:RNA polymerase sigma-70 factor (ECF subfamily)|nr:sigma-70 family RNA polymerase sigma factor [Mycobacteriales bacterium]
MPPPPPPGDGPEWDDAFTALCDRYRLRLVRWVAAIFGARDAEDIAQETLVRLFQRPELLADDRDVWPWLAVVARNVGRDLVRHNAQSSAVDHLTLAEVPDAVAVWDHVVARDDAERLVRALRRLSARDRQLIRLRDVQGVSMAELAGLVGVTENTARQQLFRARRRLADAYTALGGDRQLGLLGTLGLRVREAFRRHWNALDALGVSSPGVLAAVVPCLACVVGAAGAAVFGPPPAPAAAAALRTVPVAEARDLRDLPHGVTAVRAGGPAATGVRAVVARPFPPKDPPAAELHRKVGGATVGVTFEQAPFEHEQGPSHEGGVYVDVPGVGEQGVGWEEWNSSGGSTVCETGVVTCR